MHVQYVNSNKMKGAQNQHLIIVCQHLMKYQKKSFKNLTVIFIHLSISLAYKFMMA